MSDKRDGSDGPNDKDQIVEPPPMGNARLSVAVSNAKTSGGARPSRQRAPRELPRVNDNHEMDRTVTESIEELSKHPDVYQKDGKLVTVSRGYICELSHASLKEKLTGRLVFLGNKDGRFVPKKPEDSIVAAILHRGEWKGVRELNAVSRSPFLRRDGSLCQERGYDPQSKIYCALNTSYETVKDIPTRDDAMAALYYIYDLIGEFPFKKTEDGKSPSASAFFALMLTITLRNVIRGNVPAFGISANGAGSGKSYLGQIASIITTGEYSTQTLSEKEELRKTISSCLLMGKRVMFFDNVKNDSAVKSPELDRLITSAVWEDRELRTNSMLLLQNNVVVMFTGNGLKFSGDTYRRVLLIELEKAEERTFKYPDVIGEAFDRQPKLLVALLTIARAWFVAGCPKPVQRMWPSFEGWSSVVPQILVWLGCADPNDMRSAEATVDQDITDMATVASVWRRVFGDKSATTGMFLTKLYPDKTPTYDVMELRVCIEEALGSFGRQAVSQALTYRMRRLKGRKLDKMNTMFVADGSAHNATKWRVITESTEMPQETKASTQSNPSMPPPTPSSGRQSIPSNVVEIDGVLIFT